MKKERIGAYKETMSKYADAAPTATGTKRRQPQPYEQTGKELLDTLKPETREQLRLRAGRPRKKTLEEDGDYVRTSFVMRAEQVEKFRLIANREGVTLKSLVEESFKNSISAYEAKHGEIKLTKTVKNSAEGIFS